MYICLPDYNDCYMVNCSGNGNCTDIGTEYNCTCEDGFYGDDCERKQVSIIFRSWHQSQWITYTLKIELVHINLCYSVLVNILDLMNRLVMIPLDLCRPLKCN